MIEEIAVEEPTYLSVEEYAEQQGITPEGAGLRLIKGKLPDARLVDGAWQIPADAVELPPEGYLTVSEFAARYGVTPQAVRLRLSRRRFKDAVQIGNKWYLPPDAEMPSAQRRRSDIAAAPSEPSPSLVGIATELLNHSAKNHEQDTQLLSAVSSLLRVLGIEGERLTAVNAMITSLVREKPCACRCSADVDDMDIDEAEEALNQATAETERLASRIVEVRGDGIARSIVTQGSEEDTL